VANTRKRVLWLALLAIVLLDAGVAWGLWKSRTFSHLAVWEIRESGSTEEFSRPPPRRGGAGQPPGPLDDTLSLFRREIEPRIASETDEWRRVLAVAAHVVEIGAPAAPDPRPMRWDAPAGLLRQIREERRAADCSPRAVLFATYLAGIGINARLWAMENDRFRGVAHTASEVYLTGPGKWVFCDVMFGVCVLEDGVPLSLLEFRDRLLHGNGNRLTFLRIPPGSREYGHPLDLYRRSLRDVLLLVRTDFVRGYASRYGVLNGFQECLDRLPDPVRRALDALTGGQVFLHYVDRQSESFEPQMSIARAVLRAAALGSLAAGSLAVGWLLRRLRRALPAGRPQSSKRTARAP
jgi:hypothetical protein